MVLIKEQYIKSVEILKKGMLEDVVLPPVSLSALHEKEVRRISFQSYLETNE